MTSGSESKWADRDKFLSTNSCQCSVRETLTLQNKWQNKLWTGVDRPPCYLHQNQNQRRTVNIVGLVKHQWTGQWKRFVTIGFASKQQHRAVIAGEPNPCAWLLSLVNLEEHSVVSCICKQTLSSYKWMKLELSLWFVVQNWSLRNVNKREYRIIIIMKFSYMCWE